MKNKKGECPRIPLAKTAKQFLMADTSQRQTFPSHKKGLSLYIHIPFCVKKCLYCDFLSASASDRQKQAYVEALLGEMDFWKETLQEQYTLKTVFIGGGTPTCLTPEQLFQIGEKLITIKEPDTEMEFTIEANPGTITEGHMQVMKEIGVNRISLGLQSAQNRELAALGRIHTYEEFLESYYCLREYGFCNINIDLMADIPVQTIESYRQTLEKVLALNPEHISSYSLIVEEGTFFYKMQEKGMLNLPDEDTDREMYALTKEMLLEKGYRRYEISNYAKNGRECLHNLTYWQMGEYLGMGLGAASYFSGYRFQNTRQMDIYEKQSWEYRQPNICQKQSRECRQPDICQRQSDGSWHFNRYKNGTACPEAIDRLKEGLIKTESFEKLGKKEEMEEFVFLGLRMMEGISLPEYQKRFGMDFRKLYRGVLEPLLENSLLAESENHDRIYLTSRGIDVSNRVLAEFLLSD